MKKTVYLLCVLVVLLTACKKPTTESSEVDQDNTAVNSKTSSSN